jgi:hypothetical protein
MIQEKSRSLWKWIKDISELAKDHPHLNTFGQGLSEGIASVNRWQASPQRNFLVT